MDDKNPLASVAAFHFNQQYRNQQLGSRLASAKATSADKSDPKSGPQLQAACRDMESLFLSYLLKEMDSTVYTEGGWMQLPKNLCGPHVSIPCIKRPPNRNYTTDCPGFWGSSVKTLVFFLR